MDDDGCIDIGFGTNVMLEDVVVDDGIEDG